MTASRMLRVLRSQMCRHNQSVWRTPLAWSSSDQEVQPPQASVWAFSYDVRQMLGQASREYSGPGEQCRVTYTISIPDDTSTSLFIPPKAHVSHLAQITDFHLNANHYFFDYSTLDEQWGRASSQAAQSRPNIWHVKILMIIAFGKLFLEKGGTHHGPPGIQEFLQCVKTISTVTSISQDPLPTMETLCLMAYYAQAADMHTAANLYVSVLLKRRTQQTAYDNQIGQASRLARSFRLDQTLSGPRDTSNSVAFSHLRLQKLWWNICVLDQRLAATIDATPDVCFDKQLNQVGLDKTHESSSDFGLRATLSIATVLMRVTAGIGLWANLKCAVLIWWTVISSYRGKNIDMVLVKTVSQQFAFLSRVGKRINATEPLCYGQSLTTISRSAASLYLSYCHVGASFSLASCKVKANYSQSALWSPPNHSFYNSLRVRALMRPRVWPPQT